MLCLFPHNVSLYNRSVLLKAGHMDFQQCLSGLKTYNKCILYLIFFTSWLSRLKEQFQLYCSSLTEQSELKRVNVSEQFEGEVSAQIHCL